MGKALTKVIYKPTNKGTDEYTVIVNPEEYKKWKEGDTSIPLIEVVDSFTILHSQQGNQGLLGAPSKQQLDADFGTTDKDKIILEILKNGKDQASDGISPPSHLSINPSRGNGNVELNRGGWAQ